MKVNVIRDWLTSSDAESVQALVESCRVFNLEEIETAQDMVRETQEKGKEQTGYNFVFMDHAGEVAGYACYGHIGVWNDNCWKIRTPSHFFEIQFSYLTHK